MNQETYGTPGKAMFLRIRKPLCIAIIAMQFLPILPLLAEAVLHCLSLLTATGETILLDLAFFAFAGFRP